MDVWEHDQLSGFRAVGLQTVNLLVFGLNYAELLVRSPVREQVLQEQP